jgi:quercetin dioxygenase-like cupin family protein
MMAQPILKNIPFEQAIPLQSLVNYQEGQIVSRTLIQNNAVSITLFAFDKNEEISTHESKGDALIYILEGEGCITIGGKLHIVKAGESIVMPAQIPHAVRSETPFKMLLVVTFPIT